MRILSVTGTGTARTVARRMARGGEFVAHQGRAGLLAERDLFDGAAEIDVDQIGAAVHSEACGFCHRSGFASGELEGGNAADAIHLGHAQRIAVFPDHRPGGDHFGDNHAGAEFFGQPPEG